MKKGILSILGLSLVVSIATTSCRNNSTDETSAVTSNVQNATIDPNNFQGEVKAGETITLDATKVYNLTGALMVKDGGKLVIPAGTQIIASKGTSSYITIEQGGQIEAKGTSEKPIVFKGAKGTPGEWGGIVICGRAPINKGETATAEVGNSVYGGKNSADNSGSLSFVVIRDAGAVYSGEKEFNGLSLFGVGSGTQINNIALINGSDDGIEFFGGSVNVSNIISVGNEDDAFDWTEGWNGTATNIYGKRREDGTGNRGIEADNNSNNHDANPRSNPTIKNATFIGGKKGEETQGIKLRVGTYASIDNLVLVNWAKGIDIEHDATLSYFNGNQKITNVDFINVDSQATGKDNKKASVALLPNTYTHNPAASGAGNREALPSWAKWAGL